MRLLLVILVMLPICFAAVAQTGTNDPAAIRQQMAEIRRSTNWNDPQAAKEANAKIESLAVKLTQAIRAKNTEAQKGQAVNQEQDGEQESPVNTISQEIDDFNNDLWNQMMKIAREHGTWDLAEPLREQIVEEYEEDESPKDIRPEVLEAMTVLVLDMTVPTVQRVIDVMDNFRAIETLVITGGKTGAPVDLSNILRKASDYPLKYLYIINFRYFVSDIPVEINSFSSLNTVALFNNNLKNLPDLAGCASSLDTLLIDMNPVSTILPGIESFTRLKKLGLVRTAVSEAEIKQLQQYLPQCTILLK